MAAKKNNDDDLLSGLDDELGDDVVDLLDTLDDAGAPAWVPEDEGEGIQGTVTSVAEQDDEYNAGEKVPVVTVEVAGEDGPEKLRVIGFSSVLRREIHDANPEVGDTFAVKYFGERELTKGKFKGKPYKLYKAAVRKARKAA